MGLPAGVTTATVTTSAGVSFTGTQLSRVVSIVPSVPIVHTASGIPLVNMIESQAIVAGGSGSFVLPHVDQNGFQDGSGASYKNWYYVATIQDLSPSSTAAPVTKSFQVLVGQSTVDLDLLPTGIPAVPNTAPIAGITSVVGQTGTVTGAQIAADPALTATYATGGEVRSKVKTDGTDQTTTLQNEMTALHTAGGGTLVLPAGTITLAGTLTLPGDSATPVPSMNAIRIVGQGSMWATRGTIAPKGGTVLDIKGVDTYGKIKGNATGLFSLEKLTLKDSAGTTTPFLYVTNTILHVQECAFIGTKSGILCDQDAIVLGGPNQVEGGAGWTDGFQGYGTFIGRNYFNGTRRAVLGQAFCNGIVIRDNTIWNGCGSNLAGGACIEINGRPTTGTQYAVGNVIDGNLVEIAYYPYGIKLDYASGVVISANNFYDPTTTTLAYVRMEANATSNVINLGYFDATKPGVSAVSPELNTIVNPFQTGGNNQFPWPTIYRRGIKTDSIQNYGPGTPEIMLYQTAAYPSGIYVVNGATPNGVVSAPTGSLCIPQRGGADMSGVALWIKETGTNATTGWVPVGASTPLTTKTANYTATADDGVIVANGTTLTITLPSAVTAQIGRKYAVKNINASAVTVGATAGTLDGAATQSLAQWAKATYVSDGANWLTV